MIKKLGRNRKSKRPIFPECKGCEDGWEQDEKLNCYEIDCKKIPLGVSKDA